MTRSKMQLSCRQDWFEMNENKNNRNIVTRSRPSPVLEIPHPRLPLTKSMIDLICPRKQLAENRAKGLFKEALPGPGSKKRSLIKLDSSCQHRHCDQQTYKKNIRRVEYGSNTFAKTTMLRDKDPNSRNNKVTLCPSPSGNNISLSCVIDRNLLKQLDKPVDLALEGITAQTKGKHNAEMMQKLEDQLDELMMRRSTSGESIDRRAAAKGTSRVTSSGRFSLSSGGNAPLTSENLLVYDMCNRTTQEEKMRLVGDWVEEVNRKITARKCEVIICQTSDCVRKATPKEKLGIMVTSIEAAANLGIPGFGAGQPRRFSSKKLTGGQKLPQKVPSREKTLLNQSPSPAFNVASVTFKSGVNAEQSNRLLPNTNRTTNVIRTSSPRKTPSSPRENISPFLLSREKIVKTPQMRIETAFRCQSSAKERTVRKSTYDVLRQSQRKTLYSPT